ncbi:MAG: thioesterase family protein [Chitinophagales bacterium]
MHTHSIKVRGFHCDMFGHVNNARYLELLEETRWEWLNKMTPFEYFEKKNMSFVVVRVAIDYRRPAVLNDVLEISVDIKEITNKSATVHQNVIRQGDQKLIAEADVTFVMVDNASGKSIPIDADLIRIMQG